MSKVKIQGNASGTGVVTLTAPNTNTDRTITLPDSTGSILDSTSTLDATKLSGNLPAIDGSALTGVGKVLQVVQTSGVSAVTVNTSTPTTVVSRSITIRSGSKVLITACGDMNPGTTGDWQYYQIYRDTAAVGQRYIGQTSGGSHNLPFSITTLDAPSTNGTYTYSLKAYNGSGSITYGETGSVQTPTIVVQEIAG
jgi:hypothetical protein